MSPGKPKTSQEAAGFYRQAIALKPDHVESYNNLGACLQEREGKESVAALMVFGRALAIAPNFAAAHYNVGTGLQNQGKLDDAARSYRRALDIMPELAEAHFNLGNIFRDQGKWVDAAASYRLAVVHRRVYAEAQGNLGLVLDRAGKLTEAALNLRHAVTMKPDFAAALGNLGSVLGEVGDVAAMNRLIGRAIRVSPRQAGFYHGLATARLFAAGDPLIGEMERLLAEPICEEDQKLLHFALGKAFDDIGRYTPAFEHFRRANALHRRTIPYDESKKLEEFERISHVFTHALMGEHRAVPSEGREPTPIFILGMPRSGTSLIEQILASHPRIHGAGELSFFAAALSGTRFRSGLPTTFPEIVPALNDEELTAIGVAYASRLRELAPEAARITDKMPDNFRFAGLISLALPRAKIIHLRRDPVDTCLSCFTKLFREDQPFVYDLTELGHYWRGYDRLMAHWHEVLPKDSLLDVSYEAVVADLEGQARRIVDYCGLDWDPACLTFHKTERPVRTASNLQVRQPIYKNAVGRWQGYGPLLDPLRAALKG